MHNKFIEFVKEKGINISLMYIYPDVYTEQYNHIEDNMRIEYIATAASVANSNI